MLFNPFQTSSGGLSTSQHAISILFFFESVIFNCCSHDAFSWSQWQLFPRETMSRHLIDWLSRANVNYNHSDWSNSWWCIYKLPEILGRFQRATARRLWQWNIRRGSKKTKSNNEPSTGWKQITSPSQLGAEKGETESEMRWRANGKGPCPGRPKRNVRSF